MATSPIDRMTAYLAAIEPDLNTVTSAAELRQWAEAVVDGAGATSPWSESIASDEGGTDAGGATAHVLGEHVPVRSLRAWELRLAEVLERLRARGELPHDSDSVAMGAAFAALIYGGLLLEQGTQQGTPLWVAVDMAMSRLVGLNWRSAGPTN